MLKNAPILPRSGEKNSKFVFPQKKSFGSGARGAGASAKEERARGFLTCGSLLRKPQQNGEFFFFFLAADEKNLMSARRVHNGRR